MLRAVFSAVVTSAALLAAAGVQAQTGAYYVATPAAAQRVEEVSIDGMCGVY